MSRSGVGPAPGIATLTTTYTYDTENRLTQLASGGNTIGTYAYDGAGTESPRPPAE